MSMKFTPAASMRTSACPLAGLGVGSSTSFITSGPPGLSIRIARMALSRHVAGAASTAIGYAPSGRNHASEPVEHLRHRLQDAGHGRGGEVLERRAGQEG